MQWKRVAGAIGFCLAWLCSPMLVQATAAPQNEESRRALDDYFDLRFLSAEKDSATTKGLAERFRNEKLSISDVEKLIRSARLNYPAEPEKGKLLPNQPLTCDHVDYNTVYFLYVPKSYNPKKAAAVLIVGHGGNGAMNRSYAERAAKGGAFPWLPICEKEGIILAAPLTERGWAWIGDSIVLSTLSQIHRRFHIDPDRVYLTGHSMGGHLSYRSGIFMPDRWAAISPMSGGYDYVENKQVYNLFNVPGYTTFGTNEPYQINTFNNRINQWMKDHQFDWIHAEKQGGHEIFRNELPKIAKFFAERPRNLYRPKIYVRNSGGLVLDKADANPRWNARHEWSAGKTIDRSTFHWLRLVPLDDPKIVQSVKGEIVDRHTIRITAENSKKLRIYLHPTMVDFDQPVIVTINGQKVHEQKVIPSMETMLALAREFDDRGRIFHAELSLDVAGSQSPGEPQGPQTKSETSH